MTRTTGWFDGLIFGLMLGASVASFAAILDIRAAETACRLSVTATATPFPTCDWEQTPDGCVDPVADDTPTAEAPR